MYLNNSCQNIIYSFDNNTFLNEKSFWEFVKLEKLNLTGTFAILKKTKDGNYYLARDPSGSKKIFYGYSNKLKKIFFSNNFIHLAKKKHLNINSIRSIEKGSILKINSCGKVLWQKFFTYDYKKKIDYKNYVKKNLIRFLKNLKKIHGDNCAVCLSGGLDSTLIAYYASKIFNNLKLINIHLQQDSRRKNIDLYDSKTASKISKYLKCKLIKLKINQRDLNLRNLKKIMYASQDYRDYNIHCATLNFFIAKHIDKKTFVLTGDFMNEYFADYKEEIFDNQIYYKNPNVDIKTLQIFFMRSLDSSDREGGIFNYFNIPLYQPYSIFFQYFQNLKLNVLKKKNSKYLMNSKLIPKGLFKLILREKTRAQVGDSEGGILGFFVKKGYDANFLRKFFIKNFSLSNKWLKKFFRIGSYKI